jgi:hypothetical protein
MSLNMKSRECLLYLLFVLSLMNMVSLSMPVCSVTIELEILETGKSRNGKFFRCVLRSWRIEDSHGLSSRIGP